MHVVRRIQKRLPGRAQRVTAALIAVAVTALVLGGLWFVARGERSAPPVAGTVASVDDIAPPEAIAEEVEYFEAGAKVTLRSGLTITIPAGWDGRLRSTPAKGGGVLGVLGRYGASENLRLQRIGPSGRRERIVLSSSREPEAWGSGVSHIRDVGAVALLRTGSGASTAPSLLIAQTHLEGAQFGAVLLGRGGAEEAEAALRAMWALLQVEGAPLTSAVEPPTEL